MMGFVEKQGSKPKQDSSTHARKKINDPRQRERRKINSKTINRPQLGYHMNMIHTHAHDFFPPHRDLDEVARAVRANQQRLVHRHRSPEHRAPDDDPNTPHLVNAVDGEVHRGQVRLGDLQKAVTKNNTPEIKEQKKREGGGGGSFSILTDVCLFVCVELALFF